MFGSMKQCDANTFYICAPRFLINTENFLQYMEDNIIVMDSVADNTALPVNHRPWGEREKEEEKGCGVVG